MGISINLRSFLFFTLTFVVFVTFGQYENVQNVPNPKSNVSDGFVSNPDGIISQQDVAKINGVLSDLRGSDKFEIAVVALKSIGTNVIEDYGTELFNHWGLGDKNRDDGLLILLVLDQRTVRFETGYGTESVMPDLKCYDIQQESMVPYFKMDQYSEGMVEGVIMVADFLTGKQISDQFAVNRADELERVRMDAERAEAEAADRRKERVYKIILGLAAWHGVGLTLFLVALLLARFKKDPYAKYNTIKYFHAWIWVIFFPATHFFIVPLAKRLKARYREMIRFSHKSGEIMRKLTEEVEDEFLSKGQIAEELVKSIDYDVWITDDKQEVLALAYKPLFSKYTKCPNCKYKTYYKVYDKQVVAPTYYSSGQGEKKYECVNCKFKKVGTYRIPKLQRSSSTRSSGGGWVSSGGGGGFSGGGGGSWGGGSSGGGGSSSSW